MDREEYLQKTNVYIVDFIKFGDAKAGSILTLSGLIAGGVGSKAHETILKAFAISNCTGWVICSLLLVILFFFLRVAYYSLIALNPQLPPTQFKSLNSFPDIASYSEAGYVEQVKKIGGKDQGDPTIIDQCSAHNWVLSGITLNKYAAIGKAVKSLMYVIAFTSVYLIVSVIVRIV